MDTKKYRRVTEFERLTRAIDGIKNGDDFSIVERQIETAKDFGKVDYVEYQLLLNNLKPKIEEMRLYDKTLKSNRDDQ